MNRLAKLVSVALLLCTVFLSIGAPSAEAFSLFGNPCSDNPDATVCQDSKQTQSQGDNSIYGPNGIVSTIVNILSLVIGVAAVIMIIVAGIQFMLSNGDANKVSNAKNTIIYAVIGLAVAVLARTLVVFVIGRL